VEKLLKSKERETRELSKNLFWYDYLDNSEIESVLTGKKIQKEKVREWDHKEHGTYAIKF